MIQSQNKLPGWMGAVGIAAWVWYWDNNHEPISRFAWRHPPGTALVWSYLLLHLLFKIPKKVLIWW